MNDSSQHPDDPNWLDEFEDLANRQLDYGSSCEQVHPLIERWFQKLMENDPPESRASVEQAMSCLSTEVLNGLPDDLIEPLLEHMTEDDLATWVQHILLIGRAFESSLHNGELDDL
jgi:hypothetical protein